MKKILLGLFAVGMLAFVACQKENITPATTNADTTASRVASTTTDGTISQALVGVDTPQGKPKKIKFDSLPANAQKFLLENIDTATIKVIVKNVNKKDGTTTYVVILKDGTRLYFDAEGNKIDPPTHNGPGGGNGEPGAGPGTGTGGGEPGPCSGTAPEKITIDLLPAAAQEYIKTNYPAGEVKTVIKITKKDCTIVYQVMLKDGNKPKMLLFDEKGNVITKK